MSEPSSIEGYRRGRSDAINLQRSETLRLLYKLASNLVANRIWRLGEHTDLVSHMPFEQTRPKASKDIRAINSLKP